MIPPEMMGKGNYSNNRVMRWGKTKNKNDLFQPDGQPSRSLDIAINVYKSKVLISIALMSIDTHMRIHALDTTK